jgi:hypothetical protein
VAMIFVCICLGRAGSEREGPQERPTKRRKTNIKQVVQNRQKSDPNSSKHHVKHLQKKKNIKQVIKHRQICDQQSIKNGQKSSKHMFKNHLKMWPNIVKTKRSNIIEYVVNNRQTNNQKSSKSCQNQ